MGLHTVLVGYEKLGKRPEFVAPSLFEERFRSSPRDPQGPERTMDGSEQAVAEWLVLEVDIRRTGEEVRDDGDEFDQIRIFWERSPAVRQERRFAYFPGNVLGRGESQVDPVGAASRQVCAQCDASLRGRNQYNLGGHRMLGAESCELLDVVGSHGSRIGREGRREKREERERQNRKGQGVE
jgi:hypothetical protein